MAKLVLKQSIKAHGPLVILFMLFISLEKYIAYLYKPGGIFSFHTDLLTYDIWISIGLSLSLNTQCSFYINAMGT